MDERILENASKLVAPRTVNFRVLPDVHRQLADMAAAAGRSVDFIVRGIVMTYLEDHPVDPLPSDCFVGDHSSAPELGDSIRAHVAIHGSLADLLPTGRSSLSDQEAADETP